MNLWLRSPGRSALLPKGEGGTHASVGDNETIALLKGRDVEQATSMPGPAATDKSHGRAILGIPVSIFAGGLYCCASMSMVSAFQTMAGHHADACRF